MQSLLRANKSVGAGAAQVTLAAGASADVTVTFKEAMVLGRLIGSVDAVGSSVEVTDIKIDNDGLLSGSFPLEALLSGAVGSPILGHRVDQTSTLVISLKNNHGVTAAKVILGVTADTQDEANAPVKGSGYRGGRSHIAIGVASTSIGAGATVELTFAAQEAGGILDRLFLSSDTGLNELEVVTAAVDTDGLISNTFPASNFAFNAVGSVRFGHGPVTKLTSITVSIKNNGAGAANVIGGFSLA